MSTSRDESLILEVETLECRKHNSSPLPQDKQYHAFFSYRDTEFDRSWVRDVVNNLEKEHNLNCCDHLRDFIPGRKIMDNINFFVPQSMKTIIVLSKEYNESFWCKYEMEYTLCMSMEKRQHMIIPVVIEDCDIPEHLKPLTYLDCRGDKTVWLPKLLNALKCKTDNQFEKISSLFRVSNANYNNLDLIYQESAYATCCLFNCYFDGKYVPQELDSRGVAINLKDFMKVRTRLELAYRSMLREGPRLVFLCLSILAVSLLISGLFLTVFGQLDINKELRLIYPKDTDFYHSYLKRNIGISFIVIGALSIIVSYKGHIYVRKKSTILRLVCVELQRTLKDNNLMCVFYTGWISLTVFYFYYNWTPCVLFTMNQLKNRVPEKEKNIVKKEDITEEKLQDTSTELLCKISVEYIYEFCRHKLEHGNSTRHCRRVICLCEYAEKMEKIVN